MATREPPDVALAMTGVGTSGAAPVLEPFLRGHGQGQSCWFCWGLSTSVAMYFSSILRVEHGLGLVSCVQSGVQSALETSSVAKASMCSRIVRTTARVSPLTWTTQGWSCSHRLLAVPLPPCYCVFTLLASASIGNQHPGFVPCSLILISETFGIVWKRKL